MSLTIVITFVVCWTPYFVVYNIRVFSDYKYNIPESLMVLADTLALMNSAVNPIIYGCFNLRIRQGLQEACCFNLNVNSEYVGLFCFQKKIRQATHPIPVFQHGF